MCRTCQEWILPVCIEASWGFNFLQSSGSLTQLYRQLPGLTFNGARVKPVDATLSLHTHCFSPTSLRALQLPYTRVRVLVRTGQYVACCSRDAPFLTACGNSECKTRTLYGWSRGRGSRTPWLSVAALRGSGSNGMVEWVCGKSGKDSRRRVHCKKTTRLSEVKSPKRRSGYRCANRNDAVAQSTGESREEKAP